MTATDVAIAAADGETPSKRGGGIALPPTRRRRSAPRVAKAEPEPAKVALTSPAADTAVEVSAVPIAAPKVKMARKQRATSNNA
ncbi:MAG TPA: hypothetical protein VGW38_24500, partial [Chloroflexota bacterium]|nr:hypothetical protein [Chloroflexota bacterium]